MILKEVKVKIEHLNLVTNCYIIVDEKTKEAMVIDPGAEGDKIINMLDILDCKLKYRDTFNTLMKLLVPNILMLLVLIGMKFVLPLNLDSRVSCLIYITVNALVGGIIYAIVLFKNGPPDAVIISFST